MSQIVWLAALFSLYLPALAQQTDYRRVDMLPIGHSASRPGYSLEEFRSQNSRIQTVGEIGGGLRITPVVSSSIQYDPGNRVVGVSVFEMRLSFDPGDLAAKSLAAIQNARQFQEQLRARQEAVKQWSRQAEQEMRDSHSFNGRLAEASREFAASLRADNQKLRQDSSEYLASMANALSKHSSIDVQKIRQVEGAKQVARNPLTYKTYSLNEEATKNTLEELDAALRKKDYRTAAELRESLDYNSQRTVLPADLAAAFNAHGVIVPEKIDGSLPVSPLSGFELVSPLGQARQLVQRTANQFQTVWAESRGLDSWAVKNAFAYYSGLAALRSADRLFADNQNEGLATLLYSRMLLDTATGFVHGLGAGIKESLDGLSQAAIDNLGLFVLYQTDKAAFFEKAKEMVYKLPEVAEAVIAEYRRQWEVVKTGTAYERSVIAGRATADILVNIATEGRGKVAAAMKPTDRLTGHVLRSSDKVAEEAFEKAGRLPPKVAAVVADPTIPLEKRANAVALLDQMQASPNPKVRELADEIAAKSAHNPVDRVNRYHIIHNVYDAESINEYFKFEYDYTAPFSSAVQEFSHQRRSIYARLHFPGAGPGRWLIKLDVPANMGFDEYLRYAQQRLAIFGDQRTALSLVEVPEGGRLLRGIAGSIDNLPGGGVQYYYPGDLGKLKFKELTPETFETYLRGRHGL